MSYRTTATGTSLLAGSTVCYLLSSAQLATFGSYSSGSPPALPVLTLDAAVLGQFVIISNGGTWQTGKVIQDGSSYVTGGQAGTLALSARAIDLLGLVGYSPPTSVVWVPTGPNTSVETFLDPSLELNTLTAVSADGHADFTNARLGTFYGTPLTTLGSITPGRQCLVEKAPNVGPWVLVQY